MIYWMKYVLAVSIGLLLIQPSATAGVVRLTYVPEVGESAEYVVQIESNAQDEAGRVLTTSFTGILKKEILEVRYDSADDYGAEEIAGTTIRLSKSDTVARFASGDEHRTVVLPGRSATFEANQDGTIARVLSGEFSDILTETFVAVYERLSTEEPAVGMTWINSARIRCLGETIPIQLRSSITGRRIINGEDCIVVSTSGDFQHVFHSAGIRTLRTLWRGDAYYAHEKGRFLYVVVEADVQGFDQDGKNMGTVKIRFNLVPRRDYRAYTPAVIPSASTISFNWSIPAGLILMTVLALALIRKRMIIAAHALAATLILALAFYGMPLSTAEAETVPSSALITVSTAAHEVISSVAGMTAVAGAGICMGNTNASSLGVAYSAAPLWSTDGHANSVSSVPADFLRTVAKSLTGVQQPAKTGAGLLTATNLLVGGGAAVAAGGATSAIVGATGSTSSSSSSGSVVSCPTTNPSPVTTSDTGFILLIKATGAPDGESDVVNVLVNGSVVISNATLGTGYHVTGLNPLNLNAVNAIEIEYVSGGSNNCILADVVIDLKPSNTPMLGAVRVGAPAGNRAIWNIIQQQP